MRRTEVLRLQHAELAGLTDRLEGLLTPALVMAEPARICDHLSTLARVLTHHAAQEDERLYPALFTHPNERVRETAHTLHREFGVIYAAVEVFLMVWTRPGAIEGEPLRFIAETTAALQTLRARIAREDAELYAVIDAL